MLPPSVEMKGSIHIGFSLYRQLLFCLLCCIQFSIHAQTRIEIQPNSQWNRTLIEELEVMSDEQREWSAESLFATSDDLFEPNTVDAKPVLHNYWARFELANTTKNEQWVSFQSYYWDYVTLYFRDSTGHVTVIPFGILSNPYNNKFLVRPQSEYDVLANFESSAQFRREDNINLVIESTLSALERKTFTNYMDGIIFGIIFGLAFYNLFLFISFRDRTYFWYTLYILSFAFSFMTLFANAPPKWTQFFTPDYPFLAFYIKKIADPLIWISYVNFVRNFLVTKDRHPVWDNVLKFSVALIILQFLVDMTGIYVFTSITRIILWNIVVVVCIALAIISYLKGYTRARFFILGQFFLLAGIVITFKYYAELDVLFFLPESEFFNYFRAPSAIFFFGAVEAIVFSLALANKYNMLQKDITRVQIEKEKEKSEALRLQDLDNFKTRFYANITHEFRTPLTVIEGMANELEKKPEKEASKKLNLIKKNSKNLLALVNQMLDLSKLKAGKMELDLKQSDIIPFIRYLVESHESFAKLQNLGLQFYSEEQSLLMDFDAKKLERVLTNLLTNAIKFTPEYGKVLVVTKKITKNEQAHLQLLVKDSGIGISEQQIPYIFNRFHQANPIHENKGTGIGLAFVKELVTSMEGSVKVESELNKGSSFILNFPIHNNAPLDMETAHYAYSSPMLSNTHASKKQDAILLENGVPILLIIEDNTDVAYYLQTCLEDQYQILICRNGKIGVDKALEILPDIIISDVMMPEMDGFQVCKTLKEDERSSHIPIILLTAKATSEDKLMGLTQGADAYLIKPFEKAELIIRLNKLLEIRQTLQKKYSSMLISSQPVASIENKEDTYIEKVEKIVLSNMEEEEFSIHELARELHLSRSQVHRKIKALTGMSAAIYIRHIRLQKAKELLGSSELSIAEIAYQVGFKTPVYFSQAFKETFGESPNATRK